MEEQTRVNRAENFTSCKRLFIWYALKCAYQGVRNASFLENFAYVLNE